MSLVASLLIGVLFAAGTYLVLRRDLVRVVWGIALISQGSNLTIITMGGLAPARAPILAGHAGPRMDPLVQALILTAVVIGLGVTAFALILVYRVYQENESVNAANVAGWADLYGLRGGDREGGDR